MTEGRGFLFSGVRQGFSSKAVCRGAEMYRHKVDAEGMWRGWRGERERCTCVRWPLCELGTFSIIFHPHALT